MARRAGAWPNGPSCAACATSTVGWRRRSAWHVPGWRAPVPAAAGSANVRDCLGRRPMRALVSAVCRLGRGLL